MQWIVGLTVHNFYFKSLLFKEYTYSLSYWVMIVQNIMKLVPITNLKLKNQLTCVKVKS